MRRNKNIILDLRNITPHFTGKAKIITLVFIIIMLGFVNIINTSALSYQTETNINFTFNPTLSINISPSDLVIDNLTPGTTADSNNITVSVATNAAYGYTLSAIMNGNNNDLTHANGTNTFSSIATDSSLPSLTTDNTWGYSYKLSNDTNWNNYSGLSTETSKILIDSNDQTTMPIDFKIAAKAASTQASGIYTGTINFTAVTKPTPMNLAESYFAAGKTRHNGYYTMQDMTSEICNNTEVIGEGSQTELIDLRDDKVYWATKLADGHCWMTQNLDLDLSHNRPLTSEDTDLNDSSLSGAYSENYEYDSITRTITWTPKNNTESSWANSNNAYSIDVGDWYWSGDSESTDCNFLATACENFSRNPLWQNGAHGHLGNYYNWPAAIASDNSSSLNTDTLNNISSNPQNSICPKNWRLPTISNQGNIVGSTNEFFRVSNLYNTYAGDKSLIISPLYFVRSGTFYSSSPAGTGSAGFYWSSTVYSSNFAYNVYLVKNGVETSNIGGVRNINNRSIRCVAK